MLTIRKIRSADAGPVRALIRGILDTEFAAEGKAYASPDLDDPVRYYGGGKDVFLVAEQDGRLIGTVAIKEDTPETALLRRVFLSREFRGRGYGTLLLCKALDFCFDQHYQNVVFRGTETMRDAVQLCLRQGFRETDVAELNDIKLYVLTKTLAPRPPASGPAAG